MIEEPILAASCRRHLCRERGETDRRRENYKPLSGTQEKEKKPQSREVKPLTHSLYLTLSLSPILFILFETGTS